MRDGPERRADKGVHHARALPLLEAAPGIRATSSLSVLILVVRRSVSVSRKVWAPFLHMVCHAWRRSGRFSPTAVPLLSDSARASTVAATTAYKPLSPAGRAAC